MALKHPQFSTSSPREKAQACASAGLPTGEQSPTGSSHKHRTRQMSGASAHPETSDFTPPLGLGQWFQSGVWGTLRFEFPERIYFSLSLKKRGYGGET